ncbi:STAS domain-containing protein [Streptomyces sp. NPDC001828]|uniref:STAS domain-containing protein n=1 Tax=Streptomyces sp. NPDC001828 TaxID=3364615 RepID=UPI0036A790DC
MEHTELLSAVVSETDGIRVVALAGEIDHQTGSILRAALDPASAPTARIAVDLRQVSFMDSSGINILVTVHNALTEAGGWLRLAAPTEAVMRALHIVGIDSVIGTSATLEQALTY